MDEIKSILNTYEAPLKELRDHLTRKKKQRIEELERKIGEADFWDDAEHSQKVMKELKSLQDSVKRTEELYRQYEDIQILIDMAYEENDESMIKEIETELKQIESTYEELRIETLLSEEYDKDNAIVTLHAGAGGTEACDWVNMLYRMYNRWIESKGFTTEVLDYLDGDITGIKTVPLRSMERMHMDICSQKKECTGW